MGVRGEGRSTRRSANPGLSGSGVRSASLHGMTGGARGRERKRGRKSFLKFLLPAFLALGNLELLQRAPGPCSLLSGCRLWSTGFRILRLAWFDGGYSYTSEALEQFLTLSNVPADCGSCGPCAVSRGCLRSTLYWILLGASGSFHIQFHAWFDFGYSSHVSLRSSWPNSPCLFRPRIKGKIGLLHGMTSGTFALGQHIFYMPRLPCRWSRQSPSACSQVARALR